MKKRIDRSYLLSLASAVALALLVGALIMLVTGHDPLAAYGELVRGATGCNSWADVLHIFSKRQFGNTIEYAMVLFMTGLACAIGARVGIFNVGGEGQLYLGAIVSAYIGVLLAGRAAEMLAGGESAMTTGASNDLQRANEIVAAMVTELGMAGEPAVSLKALSGNGVCASDAAARCREMLSQMFARTQRLLRDNAEALFRLSDALMEHETLSGEDVDTILGHVSNDLQESTEEEKI